MNETNLELNYYIGENFKKLGLANKELAEIEFQDCTFRDCDFKEASFQACRFEGCKFFSCNLGLVKLEQSVFKNVDFLQCNLVGVNWAECSWIKKGILDERIIRFTECNLNYNIFIGINMNRWAIIKCVVKEADFEEASLVEANCKDSDFTLSRFVRTDLSNADFSSAYNYLININLNKLSGAKFSIPEAISLLQSLDIVLVE